MLPLVTLLSMCFLRDCTPKRSSASWNCCRQRIACWHPSMNPAPPFQTSLKSQRGRGGGAGSRRRRSAMRWGQEHRQALLDAELHQPLAPPGGLFAAGWATKKSAHCANIDVLTCHFFYFEPGCPFPTNFWPICTSESPKPVTVQPGHR